MQINVTQYFSVLGATLIVCGLYAVLWGKGKEMKNVKQLAPDAKTSKDSEPIKIVTGSTIDGSRHREEDHIFPKENKRNSKGDRD